MNFLNCLSAFGIVSYLKQQLSFTKRQLRESLGEALQIENRALNLEDLMSDMIESICLLQIEGTDYVFTHRSFQEYFAAVFTARSPAGAAAILDRISERHTDDVLEMAFAINRGLIEREWILPTVEKLVANCQEVSAAEEPVKLSEILFGGLFIAVSDGKPEGIHRSLHGAEGRTMEITHLYPEIFGPAYLVWRKNSKGDLNAMADILTSMLERWDERLPLPKDRSRRAYRVSTFEVPLNEEENSMLKGTSIVDYMGALVLGLGKLQSNLQRDVKSQENIVSRLIGR